jgi:hypothetical protein
MSSSTRAALIAELTAVCPSGNPPALEHATPYQWAAACHELWESGHLEVVEYAIRLLRAHYPDMKYLESLVALFDSLPRNLPAPLAFCDDPAAEIQVVRRPGSDAVLLCFCARNGTLGLPLNFIHQWLGRLPTSLMYIKDFRNLAGGCGFPSLGPDRASAVAALRRMAGEVNGKRIYTLGVSLGGYSALHYGLQLHAVAALNLAGRTDLTPNFVAGLEPLSQDYLSLCQFAPDYTKNSRDSYASAEQRPHVLIAYSAGHPIDRQQAERMAGLPNVELIAVDHAQHNVVDPLVRRGELLPLLNRLLSIERRTMA